MRVSALSTAISILTSLLECYQLEESWSHFTRLIYVTNIGANAFLLYYTEPQGSTNGLRGLDIQSWEGSCDDTKQRQGNGMKQTKSSILLA